MSSSNKTDSNGCLICDAPAPCNCKPDQQCVSTVRLCQQCPENRCIGGSSNSGSSGSGNGAGGGSNVGATVGPVIGGLAAGVVAVGLVWYFWWRPRKAARRARKMSTPSAHSMRTTSEKPASPAARSGAPHDDNEQPDVVVKRSSVHLSGPSEANRRTSATVPSPAPLADNPFGDHHSSLSSGPRVLSTATSDFSFRSSHSTTNIPISFVPRSSTSDSLKRATNEGSHERKASGAAPGMEVITMGSLPTHDRVAPPKLGSLPKPGTPSRPDRSPDLDLKLPDLNTPRVSSPLAQDAGRPQSGFPWNSPSLTPGSGGSSSTQPAANKVSHFSASTISSNASPDEAAATPRSQSSQSHLSTFSTSSDASHMSYILDPPQVRGAVV
jgi:hypothetical protein